VETELGIERGFWDLVAEGVDFTALNDGAHGAEGGGLEGDMTELLWSEAIAGALMQSLMSPELDAGDCLEHAAANCAKWGIAPPELDAGRFNELRTALGTLAEEWRSLGDEGTLVREFPQLG
jgi:hypothetical protein